MKSVIQTTAVTFFLFTLSCEEPQDLPNPDQVTFIKTFGGLRNEYGWSVQETRDGGYIIVGRTNTFGHGNRDVWLIKTDPEGNGEWGQTFGGSEHDGGHGVVQTDDGGYLITGYTYSFGNSEQMWLIKTDSLGDEEWNRIFGGSNWDLGYSLQETLDGGYIITGYTNSFGRGDRDVWLVKTNSEGDEEWNKTFGGSDKDVGYSVRQSRDGGFIVAGYTYSQGAGQCDVWVIKTDEEGNEEWDKTFGSPEDEAGYSIQLAEDGGYIIAASTNSRGNDWYDPWLIKIDFSGNEAWNRIHTGSGGEEDGWYVYSTNDGGYIITGTTNTFGNDRDDVLLIKTDYKGEQEWNKTYWGIGNDWAWSVAQTSDEGYIITGSTDSYGNGLYDVLLIKTDESGNTTPYR